MLVESAASSPADVVLNLCSASFNVLANFSSDRKHVLSFTSCNKWSKQFEGHKAAVQKLFNHIRQVTPMSTPI